MHTIDLLEEALHLARQSGFQMRYEAPENSPCGACRVGQQWFLFVDQALPVSDQLALVVQALRNSGIVHPQPDSSPLLRRMLEKPADGGPAS